MDKRFVSQAHSSMEYRFLGNTGLLVSALSFGAWLTFQSSQGGQGGQDLEDEEDRVIVPNCYHMMKTALKYGCNFFDNAETYGAGQAERVMGKVLKRFFAEGLCKRRDLVITTKIYWGDASVPNAHGLSRKHIMEAMHDSLERFDLRYVDVVYCHRPDKYSPLEETVRAMSDLVTQGKAFYWGTSEWPADMIAEAYQIAKRLHLHTPVVEQPQYNMLVRNRVENEYERLLCSEMKLGLTTWSPLASGLLSGKYSKLSSVGDLPEGRFTNLESIRGMIFKDDGSTPFEVKSRDDVERILAGLRPIADRLGASIACLCLAWVLKNPHVSSVITGASRPQQVEENFKAVEVYKKLTDADMEEIETLLGNKSMQKPLWISARHAFAPMVFPPKPIE